MQWSPRLVAILDHAYVNSTWASVQQHLHASSTSFSLSSLPLPLPFTLTHGDFHAANMLWLRDGSPLPAPDGNICVVDWAEVGVWEPCADLGQLMIADVRPVVRRAHEKHLVRVYWDKLIAGGVSSQFFPFSLCWARYQRAGVERFLWLFPLLAQYCPKVLPVKSVQFVHDQIISFIEDHCPSASTPGEGDLETKRNEIMSLEPTLFAERMDFRINSLIT